MPNPLPRALAVFALAVFPFLTASAAGGSCPFSLVKPDETGRPGPRTALSADDPICKKALALEVRYQKLKDAAAKWAKKVEAASQKDGKGQLHSAFDPAAIKLSRMIDDVAYPNAYYAYFPGSKKPGFIQVNVGFVMKEAGENGAASFGVSHELAHGVQHALGVPDEKCHRGHEAQADRWGAGILREAGLAGDQSPRQVAEFFEEERIASDQTSAREAQGCRAHPPGRTRFVNAVLGEELFGRKDGAGGSKIGKDLMALDRDKVLGVADVIFDGDRSAERPSDPAAVTGVSSPRRDFGAEGTLRRTDFEPGGKLVIRDDLILDLKNSELSAAPAQDLNGVLLGQLYRLGNITDWQSPFLHSIIAKGVREDSTGLKGALLAGLKAMSPTEIAKKNTLRLVIALQDSLGAGPVFAFFRRVPGTVRLA